MLHGTVYYWTSQASCYVAGSLKGFISKERRPVIKKTEGFSLLEPARRERKLVLSWWMPYVIWVHGGRERNLRGREPSTRQPSKLAWLAIGWWSVVAAAATAFHMPWKIGNSIVANCILNMRMEAWKGFWASLVVVHTLQRAQRNSSDL